MELSRGVVVDGSRSILINGLILVDQILEHVA